MIALAIALAGCVAAPFTLQAAAPDAGVLQEPDPPAQAEDTVPSGPEVEAVRFPGAESLEAARIQAVIETRPTECRSPVFAVFCLLGLGFAQERAYLDPEALPRDEERIETLYEIWGYPDAEVAASVSPDNGDEVVVDFAIDEGRPILVESLAIQGLEGFSPPITLPRPLPLDTGVPYGLPRLEATQQIIQDSLGERGHPYAEVEVAGEVDEAARRARVTLLARPGPAAVFGDVVVEAEPPLEEEVVLDRLAFEPGEPFRQAALRETEARLYRLPIVERVIAEPIAREVGDTTVTVRILAGTRRAQGVEAEGAISSTECVEVATFWNHRYFLGGPRLVSFGAGVSNLLARQADGSFPCTSAGEGEFADPNFFVQTELRQPIPGSPRSSLLVGGFVERQSAPNTYIQTGYGARLGLSRDLRPDLILTAMYQPARNELDAAGLFFCGNYGVCGAQAIAELSEPNWLSPVELLLFWRPADRQPQLRRPNRLVPPWERPTGVRWRSWATGALEGAGALTGSDFGYGRMLGEASATRITGRRLEAAGRARVGLLAGDDVLPPQVRFYSGGVNTVRGVAQNMLGPKVLVTATENALALGCTLEPGGCPAGLVVDPDLVSRRPLGGDLVLEANAEARIWATDALQLAGFVDFGLIGRSVLTDGDVPLQTDRWGAVATPGVGIRLITGLGPIRIDLGYDPRGAETLPLFTGEPDGEDLIPLGRVVYDRADDGFLGALRRRLQLHVAIGQPF